MLKKNVTKTIILVCTGVRYGSPLDEDMFFEWISKIPIITKFDGETIYLYLYIKSQKISRANLRELIALFYRYKVDMKQLAIFLNSSNKSWFYDNKTAYWHKEIFDTKQAV